MHSAYGWAPIEERLYEDVPFDQGTNVSLIASISRNGIGEAMTVEGAADTQIFETYLRDILVPTLEEGQIIIMDNAQIHKGNGVRKIIEDAGCELLFLPSYSPDLSPIELAFSKLKAYLKKMSARTREDLDEFINQAIKTITDADAYGWFKHCGYSFLFESL